MATIKVYGFVGTDPLPPAITEVERRRLVKHLRNYVEDRIEDEFDAWTNLSISDAGSVFVVADGEQPEATNKRLRTFAHDCVVEFCADPEKYGAHYSAARTLSVRQNPSGGIFG